MAEAAKEFSVGQIYQGSGAVFGFSVMPFPLALR
jgi:hypothetical protein